MFHCFLVLDFAYELTARKVNKFGLKNSKKREKETAVFWKKKKHEFKNNYIENPIKKLSTDSSSSPKRTIKE